MQPTTIYSSFFSSGLHNVSSVPVSNPSQDLDIDLELSETETESSTSTMGEGRYRSNSSYSPSRASSPTPIPPESQFVSSDDNDMDVDSTSANATTIGSSERAWGRRSVTPTPDLGSRQTTPVPLRVPTNSTSHRLRTRRSRSSLTQSLTSPKADIKSPNRAASNALSFQMQVHQIHNRLNLNAANNADSQSGTPSLSLRPRRLFAFARRRLPSMPIPAPAPPPTVPLPALPLQAQVTLLPPSPLEDSTQHNLRLALKLSETKTVEMPPARRRGLSKSSLAAEGHRINEVEEMKEN